MLRVIRNIRPRWRVLHNKYPNYYVAAFTVADLLEVLPKAIWDDVKGWSLLVIRFRSKGFPRVGYEAEHGIIWSCGEVSLLGNIIETIDWVITSETQIICKGRK